MSTKCVSVLYEKILQTHSQIINGRNRNRVWKKLMLKLCVEVVGKCNLECLGTKYRRGKLGRTKIM